MNDSIKQLLIEDFQYKRVFIARFAILCELCRNNIEEGQEFVFIGDKKKLCIACQMKFITELETL